jgi:hypothetical protein
MLSVLNKMHPAKNSALLPHRGHQLAAATIVLHESIGVALELTLPFRLVKARFMQ